MASTDQNIDSQHVTPGDTIRPEDIENIDNLGIRKFVVSQDEMALLANIKNLKYLMFVDCEFIGDAFAPLENNVIRDLYVQYSVVPGILGRSIQKLKNLETLGLTQLDFPDDFFKHCGALNINSLAIVEVSVRTENLKDMLPLPNLSMLMLYDTDVGDDITDFLDELPALKTLSIAFSVPNKMRSKFLRDMKNTDTLEEITIENSDIDDEILSEITRFKNLTSVIIYGRKITKDSIPTMELFANGERYIVLRNDNGILCRLERDYSAIIPGTENGGTEATVEPQ